MNERILKRIHAWPACALAVAFTLLVPAAVRADTILSTGSSGSEQLRRPDLITVLLALAILVVSLAAIPFLFHQRKQGSMWRLFTGLCATLISMALVGTLSLALLYSEKLNNEEAARQDYQQALQEIKTFPASLNVSPSNLRGWSWDLRGETLAYMEMHPGDALIVYDPASGVPREVKRYESGSYPIFHAWSEDGGYLVCSLENPRGPTSTRTFQVIDRQGNIVHELDLPESGYVSGASNISALLLTGEVLYVIEIKAEAATAVGSEPDPGTSRESRFELLTYDVTTGNEIAGCPLPPSFLPRELAYQPTGHISIVGVGGDGNAYAGWFLDSVVLSGGTLELIKVDPATLSIMEEKVVYRGSLQVYASDIYGSEGNPRSAYLDTNDRFLVLRDAGGKVLVFDFYTQERQTVPEDASKD